MALFELPTRQSRGDALKIAKKANTTQRKVSTPTTGGDIVSLIKSARAKVAESLGKYKDNYELITDKDALVGLLQAGIDAHVIAIDTETTGTDEMRDKIVGISVYVPNHKAAYIPINHISYIYRTKLENQLSITEIKDAFSLIAEGCVKDLDVIMFNAKFDERVLYYALGLNIFCTWDCFIGARLLNENEPTNALKKLHEKYVLNGQEDEFTFSSLFGKITFDLIPLDMAVLYAAHDAEITYEYYQFQKEYLMYDATLPNSAKNGMNGVAWVFHNIEMPCLEAVRSLEDNGIALDVEYGRELSEKYHQLLQDSEEEFQKVCAQYDVDNINIASPKQIAVLLYDVLNLKSPDKRNPRGTGEDILSKLDHPICKAILKYREISKLLSTYIDKLPECINETTGRLHGDFNQLGTDTGRMSSSNPNLQNIPSHNKDVRKMFSASKDYILMSSDYSQQEPKCLAALCKMDGDSQMYDTFMAGKDLYSEIASKSFNLPYEECLEHFPKGSHIVKRDKKWYYAKEGEEYDKVADGDDVYADGKDRRSQAKSILLGVLYGRGVDSIAKQLGTTYKVAKDIKTSVFKGFPAIEAFENASLDMAYNLGYVTTVCGRKRRLPDYSLPEFEIDWKTGYTPESADVLDFTDDSEPEVPDDLYYKYMRQLNKALTIRDQGERDAKISKIIRDSAVYDNLKITDNRSKISSAKRQCVNARIQGSAADLTKLAMIRLLHSEELKRMGFRLLIPVHDEIIAECPVRYAKECSQLLSKVMSEAAEEILHMPIKCDVECSYKWYGDPVDVNTL